MPFVCDSLCSVPSMSHSAQERQPNTYVPWPRAHKHGSMTSTWPLRLTSASCVCEKLGSKVEEAHKESRQEDCCQTSNQSTKKPKTHNQQMEDDFMECMVKSGFWPT